VIAIYTFAVVWWRTGKGSVRFAWSIVGAIWTYNILFITITAWHYRWENFFHPTPVWPCIYLLDVTHDPHISAISFGAGWASTT
jgi:hypothetical protein